MCGIVGYVGMGQAFPVLLNGLKRLEYRGYDSSGVAFPTPEGIQITKRKGKVFELEQALLGQGLPFQTGIGHTRWATHGEPSDRNAHPHLSSSKRFALVHNGIIENFHVLKRDLIAKGYVFNSDTDTEVLLNFIEDILIENNFSVEEAMRIALRRVVGAYVIVLIDAQDPGILYAARKGSPLVIGVGKNEHFLASDAAPIIEYTREVVYINDYEMAIVRANELILKNLGNEIVTPNVRKLDLELAQIEKGGFDHFMIKEIFDQPSTIYDCLRGRLDLERFDIVMKGINDNLRLLTTARRIILVGCGTSWHAALVAEYIIEELCRIPVEVEFASEFRYRNPIVGGGDIIIAVSQSGETADTIVAIEKAKEKGAIILGVVNVVGSSIARLSHAGAYTHAGPEIGVASTKAFTAQLVVLTMIALKIAKEKGTITSERFLGLCHELASLPEKISHILKNAEEIKKISDRFSQASSFLYLGRGYNYPIALEGALKLKEISYIHAEGYPAAEMKHGPIALVDIHLPVLFVATKDAWQGKILSNMQEINARKGRVIALVTEGDHSADSIAEVVLTVPETDEIISPILNVIPLQLLSYYIGVARGLDVDRPRNLAKSVTVE